MGRLIDRARVRYKNALRGIKGFLSSERFQGYCPICGRETIFVKKSKNLRETFTCRFCHSSSRNRFAAKILQQSFNIEPPFSLEKIVNEYPDLTIYELAAYGPIHSCLKSLNGYICSDYFYDIPLGEMNRNNIRCEDVESLTFPDDSFDIVLSQDVFEHVKSFEKGFSEIHRVLKKGGFHIFTVPFNPWGKTFRRIKLKQGREIEQAPRVYHGDPTRGGLVYSDFGFDLPEILEDFGFSTRIHWCDGIDGKRYGIYWICALVSYKI